MLNSVIPEIQAYYTLQEELKCQKERTSITLRRRADSAIKDSRGKDPKMQLKMLTELAQEIRRWCDESGEDFFHLSSKFDLLRNRLSELYVESGSGPCDHPLTYSCFKTCIVCGRDRR